MCYTYRHDYGITRSFAGQEVMNDAERKAIWNQMAQIYDNDIAPVMEFKK